MPGPNDRLKTLITSFPLNHTVSINKTAPILKILLLICFYCQKSVIFLCSGSNTVLLEMSIYLPKSSKQNKDKVLHLGLRNVRSQVKTFYDVVGPFNFSNSGDTVLFLSK